jgi:hypothetical protein
MVIGALRIGFRPAHLGGWLQASTTNAYWLPHATGWSGKNARYIQWFMCDTCVRCGTGDLWFMSDKSSFQAVIKYNRNCSNKLEISNEIQRFNSLSHWNNVQHVRPQPFESKRVWIIYQNSVRTAKKTLHFTITKISWLTLFKEIIAVYSENLRNI